jgi:hypothetical protein
VKKGNYLPVEQSSMRIRLSNYQNIPPIQFLVFILLQNPEISSNPYPEKARLQFPSGQK